MTCISTSTLPLTVAYQAFLDEVTNAGLLIPLGVRGVYGYNGVFDHVLQSFDQLVTRRAAGFKAEVMRLPGVLSREHYLKTSHIENFPVTTSDGRLVGLVRREDVGAV